MEILKNIIFILSIMCFMYGYNQADGIENRRTVRMYIALYLSFILYHWSYVL